MSRASSLWLLASFAAAAGGCERPPTAEPAPSPAERLEEWAARPGVGAVPVALGFTDLMADSAVAGLLERHGLRPYAVYVSAAGLTTSQRRERSRASLELLAEAREQAIGQLRTSMCAQQGRARSMIAEPAPEDPLPVYRELLDRFVLIQRTLPQLEMGAPIVYGVEAVGSLPDVRAAGSDPALATFEPGWASGDTVVVPEPPAPTDEGARSESGALSGEEVRKRIAGLADNGLGACAGETGP